MQMSSGINMETIGCLSFRGWSNLVRYQRRSPVNFLPLDICIPEPVQRNSHSNHHCNFSSTRALMLFLMLYKNLRQKKTCVSRSDLKIHCIHRSLNRFTVLCIIEYNAIQCNMCLNWRRLSFYYVFCITFHDADSRKHKRNSCKATNLQMVTVDHLKHSNNSESCLISSSASSVHDSLQFKTKYV